MSPSVEILKPLNADAFAVYENQANFGTQHHALKLSDSVAEALVAEVDNVDHEACDAGDEDSFFVADLSEVVRSYKLWTRELPNVHAHYAVKCNTDDRVVSLLGQMGANFDCASKSEIDRVLSLGFGADRIVYANPCKTPSFIRHARAVGVSLTTVDNANELEKLLRYHPGCSILVRISTDDESAQCRLLTKFGCDIETAISSLLPKAKELGLDVAGVAFHVGSGAKEFDLIEKAVSDSRAIFDAARVLGLAPTILDIGGGFERETFLESSRVVRSSLENYFPAEYGDVRFIAEPGRFMVANAFTLAVHVIARRDLPDPTVNAMLYINDGVYGNLNCVIFDHQYPGAHVLKHAGETFNEFKPMTCEQAFSIWGPTCDGLDCVSNLTVLPADVHVGDWLYFPNLGAYTSAATTSFNGFSGNARVRYVNLLK